MKRTWLMKVAKRQAIRFYHWTDLDNLYSIMEHGIKPSGGSLGTDEWGRPIWTYYGAYFGRDEKSVSHGHETRIVHDLMLQGWLPMYFIDSCGEADADYKYRNEAFWSSAIYPNAPDAPDDPDEIDYKINPETGEWEPQNDPFSWDKSYWQKPYGAACVKEPIPFSWVENIRIDGDWHPKNEAIDILRKRLWRQEQVYYKRLIGKWQGGEEREYVGDGLREMFHARSLEHLNKLNDEYHQLWNYLKERGREKEIAPPDDIKMMYDFAYKSLERNGNI